MSEVFKNTTNQVSSKHSLPFCIEPGRVDVHSSNIWPIDLGCFIRTQPMITELRLRSVFVG